MSDDKALMDLTISKVNSDPVFASALIELKNKPNAAGRTPEQFANEFKSEFYETLTQALDSIINGDVKKEKEMSFRSEEIESAYEDEISSDRGISMSNHRL